MTLSLKQGTFVLTQEEEQMVEALADAEANEELMHYICALADKRKRLLNRLGLL